MHYFFLPNISLPKWDHSISVSTLGLLDKILSRRHFENTFLILPRKIAMDAKCLHADNEDSDQTARMRSLIRVFVGRTYQMVHFSSCGSFGENIWKTIAKMITVT